MTGVTSLEAVLARLARRSVEPGGRQTTDPDLRILLDEFDRAREENKRLHEQHLERTKQSHEWLTQLRQAEAEIVQLHADVVLTREKTLADAVAECDGEARVYDAILGETTDEVIKSRLRPLGDAARACRNRIQALAAMERRQRMSTGG